MKIYVGNISFDTSNEDLRSAFAAYGNVASAESIMDRETGRSRGFGFVEMANDGEAQAAIGALNGAELQGRTLTVNPARARSESRGGGGARRYDEGAGSRGGGYQQRW